MIFLSIVVPVYNVEEYLERCVKSLVNQTYDNIEVILVDDGSTDNSGSLCDEFQRNYKHVTTFHKENGGLSDARNYGLKRAKGQYILFVDSDDYIELNTCEKFQEISANKDADVIVGGAIKILKDERKIIAHTHIDNKNVVSGAHFLESELKNKSMHMPAWLNLYKKDFLSNNDLFFKKGILHEDEEFVPRVFLKATRVISSDILFYNYIIREGSITSQSNQLKNIRSILEIVQSLEPMYNSLENKALKKMLENHSVNILINGYYKNDFNALLNFKLIDIGFILRNSNNFKMKIKSIIFLLRLVLFDKFSKKGK
ncbi:glycosyltransferase [Carnobacterium sp. 1290_CSPC]|uniref:glycosyltransferase n=1 Tax=Carnobacterium sp. 1290_CSPC TaxID=1579347 RepID=UPI000660DA0E|nr:glycosyltransferase [Carnobacterium sp. 1290_CSPC]